MQMECPFSSSKLFLVCRTDPRIRSETVPKYSDLVSKKGKKMRSLIAKRKISTTSGMLSMQRDKAR